MSHLMEGNRDEIVLATKFTSYYKGKDKPSGIRVNVHFLANL